MSTHTAADLPETIARRLAAHRDLVYAFCYRVLGDERRAQTLAQRMLVQAWESGRHDTTREETLRHLAIAYRSVLKQHVRRSRWAEFKRLIHLSGAETGRVSPVADPLSALPTPARCLVILHHHCGLTLAEVSTVTGASLDQVYAQLIAAYRSLAGSLSRPERDCPSVIGRAVSIERRLQTLS